MEKFIDYIHTFFDNLNMENNSNKLCLRNSIDRFIKTGTKEDAFSVYYCFCEIFEVFGRGYENTQNLLEMLSDHEYHSGELLSKHRDHYSHSVYVFLIGLAIFENLKVLRSEIGKFYKLNHKNDAIFFLKYWGITALFHDIGYPFQLAHEQIKNYCTEIWKNEPQLYVSFGNLNSFLNLDLEDQGLLEKEFGRTFDNINNLLAYGLYLHEGYEESKVGPLLYQRIVEQPNFIDHGYFSAVTLAKKMLKTNHKLNRIDLDVLTAILLHNNFNKYDYKAIAKEECHSISLQENPLAFLLILCDELQIWDRLAYGKISKRDPIAWDVEFFIKDDLLSVTYYFDTYTIVEANGDIRLNDSYLKIKDGKFINKLKDYIDYSFQINAKVEQRKKEKRQELYMSDNNFINLCDLAKAIHASYLDHCLDFTSEYINEAFSNLPLEFKLSNIEQAKSYASKLELINCFYSSKDLDYPVIEDINKDLFIKNGIDHLGFLSREEHVRWVKEKLSLGWVYGNDYQTTQERNEKKIHKSLVPFDKLSDTEKLKNEMVIKNLIPLLRKFDSNIKIYNYRYGRKDTLEIGGIGHRFGLQNPQKIKERIKKILKIYKENYRVVVRTSYAYGAGQLIAECATELGITTKAVIPMDYEEYIEDVKNDALKHGIDYTLNDELRMRHLLAQAVSLKIKKDPINTYAAAAAYIIERCDKLIAIWDGTERDLFDSKEHKEINRGGTYHSLSIAMKEKGMKIKNSAQITDIHIIN